jgi:serine/threonine-protein kinase
VAPGLAELVETLTQRILGGEPIDVDRIAEEHPEWAAEIQSLLPVMQALAAVGRGDDAIGIAPRTGEARGEGQWVFGEYGIVRELGRGGMGIVYEAQQVALSRRIALKILPLAAAMDPRALQRFQLEAQVAGWLQHPRIVPVHAAGIVADVPYYAMQLIEGGSLADLIAALRE